METLKADIKIIRRGISAIEAENEFRTNHLVKAHLEELGELRSENINLRQVIHLPEFIIVVENDIKKPMDKVNTINDKSVKNSAFICQSLKMIRYLGSNDVDIKIVWCSEKKFNFNICVKVL